MTTEIESTDTQGRTEKQNKFIELRARGLQYPKIAKELSESKTTLSLWDEEFKEDIIKLQALVSLGEVVSKIKRELNPLLSKDEHEEIEKIIKTAGKRSSVNEAKSTFFLIINRLQEFFWSDSGLRLLKSLPLPKPLSYIKSSTNLIKQTIGSKRSPSQSPLFDAIVKDNQDIREKAAQSNICDIKANLSNSARFAPQAVLEMFTKTDYKGNM
jgi:transcriptional regulator